jgi:class 3 adenylate cyclase
MQRYASEQADMRQGFEHQLYQLRNAVFPILLEQVTQQQRTVENNEQYLAVLFSDMKGFSTLMEDERTAKVDLMRSFAEPLLRQGHARYYNTWGDAIEACFGDINAGLTCACQLTNALKSISIHIRIGMSHGKTRVSYNSLIQRLDIGGDSVNFAARLEPVAEPGEVLITEELRYHPEVQQDSFIFTPQQRSLKKAVGDYQQGEVIECYSVKLVKDVQ